MSFIVFPSGERLSQLLNVMMVRNVQLIKLADSGFKEKGDLYFLSVIIILEVMRPDY